MSKKNRPSVRGQTGEEIHAHGTIKQSLVTEETVENRARELALIGGREPNRVTASDRIQAKKYLPTDDETEIQMVEEGVNEAGHEQMVQAAKTRTKSEG